VAPLPTVFDSITAIRVATSDRMFTDAQIHDLFNVADWYPEMHPAMPAVIARGRKPAVYGCAYCHLPTGSGRPENAMLAGLPAAYIEQQVADLKMGVRRSAWREPYRPNTSMRTVAESATTAEVAEAARYFSGLRAASSARLFRDSNQSSGFSSLIRPPAPNCSVNGWLWCPWTPSATSAVIRR
jgi:cytochrome c553